MPCSRNGTAACMHPPLRIHGKLAAVGIYHPGCPNRCKCGAVRYNTGPHRRCRIVAGSSDHYRIRIQACPLRYLRQKGSRYLTGFVYLPQEGPVNIQSAQNLLRPAAALHIQKLHAAGIRNFRCKHAGQHLPDIVLWQQYMAAFLIILRLMLFYPQNFCRSPAGQRRIGSQLYPPLPRHNLQHLLHLSAGSLVAPDDGGTDYLIVFIQHHKAMHLSGKPDSFYRPGRNSRPLPDF